MGFFVTLFAAIAAFMVIGSNENLHWFAIGAMTAIICFQVYLKHRH